MRAAKYILAALVVVLVSASLSGALRLFPDRAGFSSDGPAFPRPAHTDVARMARWLVHENDWGVVSTLSRHLNGVPYGSIASFADGPRHLATGRLLFYLTPMDALAFDLELNSTVSVAVAEAALPGACPGIDAEEPTCAKATISGSMRRVPAEPDLLQEARDLLFPRHPAMKGWPQGHNFAFYELLIKSIRLLDFYGGPHDISPDDYFAADLGPVPPPMHAAEA